MKKVIVLIASLMLWLAFTVGCKPAETPKPEAPKPAEAPAPPESSAEAPAPPEQQAEAPDVVVVPSGTSYVYMVPNTIGLYFYHDYWYRFHEHRWSRAAIYGGPWAYIETSIVPMVVVSVSPDYVYHLPRGYYRIHYHDLHRHWRTWDHSRHWHRYNWYRYEERRHHGDGHKPHGDGHKPKGDGHKPPLAPHQQQEQDRPRH